MENNAIACEALKLAMEEKRTSPLDDEDVYQKAYRIFQFLEGPHLFMMRELQKTSG